MTLLIVFCLFVALICVNLRNGSGLVSMPMGFVVLIMLWLAPQLWAIRASSVQLSQISQPYVIMTMICLGASLIGWILADPGAVPLRRVAPLPPLPPRTIPALTALTVIATLLAITLEFVRPAVNDPAQWSGPATIVNFFAQIRNVSLAIAFLLFLRDRNRTTAVLLAVNFALVVPSVFIYLRRSEAVELAVLIAAGYWLIRRRLPNPALLAGLGAVLVVLVFIVGDLRRNAATVEIQTDQQVSVFDSRVWDGIDILDRTQTRIAQAPDIMNGITVINYVEQYGGLTFGTAIWNGLVQQWVPAQLIGADTKNAMMIGDPGEFIQKAEATSSFRYSEGTTSTGIASTFGELHYAGALIFMFIAYVLGRLYRRAMTGALWHQALYVTLVPASLVSVTHGHQHFFSSFPLFWGTLAIVAWWASRAAGQRRIPVGAVPRRPVGGFQPPRGSRP